MFGKLATTKTLLFLTTLIAALSGSFYAQSQESNRQDAALEKQLAQAKRCTCPGGYISVGQVSKARCGQICTGMNDCLFYLYRGGWCNVCPRPNGTCSAAKLEFNTNRRGSDIHEKNRDASSASACRNDCFANPKCKSFTFVRKGALPQSKKSGQCWLKFAIPKSVSDSCCTSGVVRP